MTRRGKTMWPTLAVVTIFLVAGYGYYMYNEVTQRLRLSEARIEKFEKRHSSMKSQLQVVYEHRAKLEGTLTKERQDHISAKQDLLTKIKEYEANVTRTRHEAFNRFNALDTQHKMLKVQYDDLVADHSRMEQQYVRLGDDHRVVVADLKEDYQKLKDAKERESKALQDRVQELYNENEVMRSDMTHQRQTLNEEKKSAEMCLEDLKKAQSEKKVLSDAMNDLNQKVATLRKALKAAQVRGRNKDSVPPLPTAKRRITVASTTKLPTTLPQVKRRASENIPPQTGIIKRHKQRLGDFKGSNLRMRHLIIRNNAMKEEDSIKDQFEKAPTEVPTEEDIDEPEGKTDKRETEFQKLVEKRGIFNGNFDTSGQTRRQGSTELKDMKTSVNAKGTVPIKAVSGRELSSESKESKSLTFDNKKETKAEEEAGKDFMKKQLHLRLQERLQSKDVVAFDKSRLSRDDQKVQNEPLPTTKRPQQLNQGLLRESKELGEKEEQRLKHPIFDRKRQLQPPKPKLSVDSKVDNAIHGKPLLDVKEETMLEKKLVAREEIKNPVKNNPVASPLKDKTTSKQESDGAERYPKDQDNGNTKQETADRVSSLGKDKMSVHALKRETGKNRESGQGNGVVIETKGMPPYIASQPDKIGLAANELTKSDPPRHTTYFRSTQQPPLSIRVTPKSASSLNKPLNVQEGERRKAVHDSNSKTPVANEELLNEPEEDDDAEGNDPRHSEGTKNRLATERESHGSKEEKPRKIIATAVKDSPIDKPIADPKEAEELEDDENGDQLGDERPNEQGKARSNVEKNPNSKYVAQKGGEDDDVKDDKDLSDDNQAQHEIDEQETQLQNDGDGLDDEDREGGEQLDNDGNNG